MSKPTPPVDFDENPEWTEEDFRRARPASQALPTAAAAQLVKDSAIAPPTMAPIESDDPAARPGTVPTEPPLSSAALDPGEERGGVQ